jgi:hypothetical protein
VAASPPVGGDASGGEPEGVGRSAGVDIPWIIACLRLISSLRSDNFPGFRGPLVSFPLPGGGQVDAAQEHGELGGVELDRGVGRRTPRDLEGAGFEPLVPDHQAVGIPVKDFDAITSSIEKEEEVAGEELLVGEG